MRQRNTCPSNTARRRISESSQDVPSIVCILNAAEPFALQVIGTNMVKPEASDRTNKHYHFHSLSAAAGEMPGSPYQRHEGTSHRLLSSSAVCDESEVPSLSALMVAV